MKHPYRRFDAFRKWPGPKPPNQWAGPWPREWNEELDARAAWATKVGRTDPNNREMGPRVRWKEVRGELLVHLEWGIDGYLDRENWVCFDGGRDVLDADVKTVTNTYCPLLMWGHHRDWKKCTADRFVLCCWDEDDTDRVALVGECPRAQLQEAPMYTCTSKGRLPEPCQIVPWYELTRPVMKEWTPRYEQVSLL